MPSVGTSPAIFRALRPGRKIMPEVEHLSFLPSILQNTKKQSVPRPKRGSGHHGGRMHKINPCSAISMWAFLSIAHRSLV